jgi:hypothetical protein
VVRAESPPAVTQYERLRLAPGQPEGAPEPLPDRSTAQVGQVSHIVAQGYRRLGTANCKLGCSLKTSGGLPQWPGGCTGENRPAAFGPFGPNRMDRDRVLVRLQANPECKTLRNGLFPSLHRPSCVRQSPGDQRCGRSVFNQPDVGRAGWLLSTVGRPGNRAVPGCCRGIRPRIAAAAREAGRIQGVKVLL